MTAAKPRAKGGLLTAKHSKRGHRFVTALDPDSMQVTLLDPWEHAVLVLCDGTLEVEAVAELLAGGVGDQPVDLPAVRHAVERFRSYRLLEDGGSVDPAELGTASPRTLAHQQQAYREWHKDPLRTGQILTGGLTPFVRTDGVAAGLDPTFALPDGSNGRSQTSVAVGTTLVVSESGAELLGPGRSITSLLSDTNAFAPVAPIGDTPGSRGGECRERYLRGTEVPRADAEAFESERTNEGVDLQNVSELLRAVDHEFAQLEGSDEPGGHRSSAPAPGGGRRAASRVNSMSETAPLPLPLFDMDTRELEAVDLRTLDAELVEVPSTVRSRKAFEAGLTPTLVGVPADDGRAEPVLLAPPRTETEDDAPARSPTFSITVERDVQAPPSSARSLETGGSAAEEEG